MTLLGPALTYAAPPGRYERRRQLSLLHPAAELLALGLVAACFAVFGASLHAAAAVVFSLALVLVTATDLEYHVVPNRIVVPAAALVLALRTAGDPSVEWILAALAASAVLYLFALVNPGGLGMGDVKLAFLIGAMLGRAAALGLVVGMVAAVVPAVVILLRHGKPGRRAAIPYAPFLAFGSVVALFV
jgi:prepilin signal peptidase PulO-like enzyme (type II secretory pathway)